MPMGAIRKEMLLSEVPSSLTDYLMQTRCQEKAPTDRERQTANGGSDSKPTVHFDTTTLAQYFLVTSSLHLGVAAWRFEKENPIEPALTNTYAGNLSLYV
jgi:hypothetical protein